MDWRGNVRLSGGMGRAGTARDVQWTAVRVSPWNDRSKDWTRPSGPPAGVVDKRTLVDRPFRAAGVRRRF